MTTTFEKFFDEAARFTREPRSAEEYLAKCTEHLEELNSFDASSRLGFMREAMAYVVKYQQVALDMCRHTIFFKRKELQASIYDVRRQILEKAKSYVEMYDTIFSGRHPEIPFYGEFFPELISAVEALDTVSNG